MRREFYSGGMGSDLYFLRGPRAQYGLKFVFSIANFVSEILRGLHQPY